MEKEIFKKHLTDYITRNLNVVNPMITKAINSGVIDIESLNKEDEHEEFIAIRTITYAILIDIADSFVPHNNERLKIANDIKHFL